jgi:serine/threonine-protein kinase
VLRNTSLPSEGQIISGKFRIVRQLGAGGMGVVFEAINEATERHVALKFLSPALSSNAEPTERFKREAKATARIHHPNVVAVQDFGEHDGRLYLVLELLRGMSLREWLLERPLNFQNACQALIPIMRGVAAAHAVGVLHRDLKPDNVFMTDSADGLDPVPKVLDFGLAKLTRSAGDPRATDLSATGMAMGTYQFMSPEQLRAQGEIDERADVYALGAILFNMVTGTTPYRADNPVDLAIQIIGAEAPSLDSLARVPPGASAVVARALARNQSARYSSVEELAVALEPFAGGMRFRGGRNAPPSTASVTPASVRSEAGPSTSPLGTPFRAQTHDESVYPARRRSMAGTWLLVALAVTLALGGTTWLLGRQSSRAAVNRPTTIHLPASLPSPARPEAPAAAAPTTLPTSLEPGSESATPEVVPAPEQRSVVPAWPDPWDSSGKKKLTKGLDRRSNGDRLENGERLRSRRTPSSEATPSASDLNPPATIEKEPAEPNAPRQVPAPAPAAAPRRRATNLTSDEF